MTRMRLKVAFVVLCSAPAVSMMLFALARNRTLDYLLLLLFFLALTTRCIDACINMADGASDSKVRSWIWMTAMLGIFALGIYGNILTMKVDHTTRQAEAIVQKDRARKDNFLRQEQRRQINQDNEKTKAQEQLN